MTATARYLPTYRQTELRHICRLASRGESLCFVGIAGTGKSNIVKVLNRHREFKEQYLGPAVDTIHFPFVDATTWKQTPASLWQLMWEALQKATGHLPPPESDFKIIVLTEEERLRRRLHDHINHVCQHLQHQVMFILDDFDEALTAGPLHMLEQLNAFRSDDNRERLSFLLFTKRLPHVLGRHHELATRSKFYDLFRMNIYALEPYRREDAQHMLRHLNRQSQPPLETTDLVQIIWLAGGHARLLKVVFETWLKDPPENANLVSHFASQVDVQEECRRVLRGLHGQEQEVALRVATGHVRGDDHLTIDHLVRRGLLTYDGSATWFSPLWGEFLRMTAAQ